LIKTPFDQLRETVRKVNSEGKELFKYVFEKSDSISLWIIGLSLGGVAIFANNIGNIQKTISLPYLKQILLLLTISVTSGIIYRTLYLYLYVIIDQINRNIDIAFSKEKTMDTESLLTGKETFLELVDVLNKGFEEDLTYLIPVFNTIDEKARKILYQSVVDHYLANVNFAATNTGYAMDFFVETYAEAYGMTKEQFEKKVKNFNSGSRYKCTLTFAIIFYFIYNLTFFAALFTFVSAT